MKKMKNLEKANRFISTLAIAVIVLLFVNCETEDIITNEDLPQSAQVFLTTHFQEETVVQVVKDNEWGTTQYEVILSNGTSLEFNESGDCTGMESHGVSLPQAAIPAPILEYVENKYPNEGIVEWDLDEKTQTVELDNGLELIFDREGNFSRLDN